jgi:hypothetical protein
MSIQGTAIAAGLIFAVIIAGIAVAGGRKKEPEAIPELGRINPDGSIQQEAPKKSCGCGH